jgi:hypothetical protein
MRLTGTSRTLPDSVRGTSATSRTSLGTWRGEQSSRHLAGDPLDEVVVERGALAQHDEQRHVVVEVDDERVGDLGQRQDGAVDLARPHPHAAAVDRRVRAARDDRGAALGQLEPVAVAPDARNISK